VLHESAVQATPSLQFAAAPGTQAPPAQASPVVQAFPSLHADVLFACWQPDTALHESVVQTFASSQFNAVPGWHTVATQVSIPLQTLLSLQSALTVQLAAGALYVTLSRGRRVLLDVVDSEDSNRSPFVPAVGGRMTHPKLLEGLATHAWRLVVTLTG
jgi:hypothetical protein